MSLATRVRTLRENKGESLQQTADAVGTSKAHVWQIERGKADNPAVGLVIRMANHFGVTVAYLVGEDPSASDADQELASMFRQAHDLSDHERRILRGMMDTLISARSKSEG